MNHQKIKFDRIAALSLNAIFQTAPIFGFPGLSVVQCKDQNRKKVHQTSLYRKKSVNRRLDAKKFQNQLVAVDFGFDGRNLVSYENIEFEDSERCFEKALIDSFGLSKNRFIGPN